jgi:hypothetical protein
MSAIKHLKAPFRLNKNELPSKTVKQPVNGPAPAKPGSPGTGRGGYLLDNNGKRLTDGRGGWLLAE